MAESKRDTRRRIEFFSEQDARELDGETMPRKGIDDNVVAALAQLADSDYREGMGERSRMLFSEAGDEGMSLVHVWFKSGYVLPFHSHSSDCLYYVLAGELRIGSRVLRQGEGFFIPADQGYGYEAGPDGVEVLEFRNATKFNLVFTGNSQERWQQMVDTCRERADIWAGEDVPPSRRT